MESRKRRAENTQRGKRQHERQVDVQQADEIERERQRKIEWNSSSNNFQETGKKKDTKVLKDKLSRGQGVAH